MPSKLCTNTWTAIVNDEPIEVPCAYDLAEAHKTRGKDLVRCPQCGKKL